MRTTVLLNVLVLECLECDSITKIFDARYDYMRAIPSRRGCSTIRSGHRRELWCKRHFDEIRSQLDGKNLKQSRATEIDDRMPSCRFKKYEL